jgi:hypothetical protein
MKQGDNFIAASKIADELFAEEAKVKLSFNDSHNILSDLGEIRKSHR